MKAVVVKDGVHTLSGGKPAHYFADYERFAKRYLATFDSVVIVGRLFEREDPISRPIIGPGVSFIGVPGFRGPRQFFAQLWSIIKIVLRETGRDSAYILRMPATLPLMFGIVLFVRNKPFAVELVGDPRDAYKREVLNSRMAWLWQRIFESSTRFLCKHAKANSYVTNTTLQIAYPPRNTSRSFGFTSLELHEDMLLSSPRRFGVDGSAAPFRVVSVGMMHNSVKGFDLLFSALDQCVRENFDIQLSIIGDGGYRSHYEEVCHSIGLGSRVTFIGLLGSFDEIAKVLDQSDLFVLASRQEGLPRVLIEAMARALPCVASRVGGVPELLPDDCTFDSENIEQLSSLIKRKYKDWPSLESDSRRNLEIAREYRHSLVQQRRKRFYEAVAASVSTT